jgi:hypothetical protein
VLGANYADTVRVTGGNGTPSFSLASGTLPPGVTLASTGRLAGTPTQAGTFDFVARATAGQVVKLLPLRIVVGEPSLAAQAVVNALLAGPPGTLSAGEIQYLDFIGNQNGQLDVGDVTAWLDRTGTVLTPALARRLAGAAP